MTNRMRISYNDKFGERNTTMTMPLNNLNVFWDSIAENYPDKVSILYSEKKRFDHSLIPPPKGHMRALDAACGIGYDLAFLHGLGYETTGFDFSTKMCHLAKTTLRKLDIEEAITLRRGDLRKIPFETHSFDLIVCFSSIDHIPSREQRFRAIEEMARVTRPEGTIIITAPNINSLLGYILHRPVQSSGIHRLYATAGRWRDNEYARILDEESVLQEGGVLQYQWEHYFDGDELRSMLPKGEPWCTELKTDVFTNPVVIYNDQEFSRVAAEEDKEVWKRGILFVDISHLRTQEHVRNIVADWQSQPSHDRGFRLGLIASRGE